MEDAPAVLSLGKLCSENGYNYVWRFGLDPYLEKGGLKVYCRHANNVPMITPASKLAEGDLEHDKIQEKDSEKNTENTGKPEETLVEGTKEDDAEVQAGSNPTLGQSHFGRHKKNTKNKTCT